MSGPLDSTLAKGSVWISGLGASHFSYRRMWKLWYSAGDITSPMQLTMPLGARMANKARSTRWIIGFAKYFNRRGKNSLRSRRSGIRRTENQMGKTANRAGAREFLPISVPPWFERNKVASLTHRVDLIGLVIADSSCHTRLNSLGTACRSPKHRRAHATQS
jgi:hypothetical protein